MLPILAAIPFTPYIPANIIALLGLIAGFIYSYYSERNSSELKGIKSLPSEHRLAASLAKLNDIGVHIDGKKLTSEQAFLLLQQSLKAKNRKFIISCITLIALALITAVLIYFYQNGNPQATQDHSDTGRTIHVQDGDFVEGDKVGTKTVYNRSDSANKQSLKTK